MLFVFCDFFISICRKNEEEDLRKVQKYSEEKLDKELRKLGYPEDFISIMPVEQKHDIVDSEPVSYGGGEKKEFYFDENGVLKESKSGDISIMGTIPLADLTIFNNKSYLGVINGRKTYRIYVNWQWNKIPFYQYKDKVALSYNDEFRTRISNNGNYSCRSYMKNNAGTTIASTDCYGRPSEISYGGASWYYDHDKYDYTQSGFAQMDIETKDATNPTGGAIILSHYYHKTGFPGSLSLNIGYASISVSSGSNYNLAATQHAFNY
ncbi:hypothetical protein ACFO0S_07150 [Chryseomicrobium palamuruense]|uniref:Lipoprotein n=1 Tax=Chryseomicrobium palamuruense TaxID=682973 RepID=A0ABV8UU41_9BACL